MGVTGRVRRYTFYHHNAEVSQNCHNFQPDHHLKIHQISWKMKVLIMLLVVGLLVGGDVSAKCLNKNIQECNNTSGCRYREGTHFGGCQSSDGSQRYLEDL